MSVFIAVIYELFWDNNDACRSLQRPAFADEDEIIQGVTDV
jgi:hypothetical protein